LALADLVYCLFQIALYGTTVNQTFRSRFYPVVVVPPPSNDISLETTLAISYQCTNFYINAVICYEVLVLLRASRRAQRITQPSLTKVNLQMGASFIIGTIAGVDFYFLFVYVQDPTLIIFIGVTLLLVFVAPFLYTFYVTFLIWCRGYIPSVNGATASDRAMRELTIYFSRIILVFIGIWIPALILTIFNLLMARGYIWTDNSWGIVVGYWLMAIQPILTFCMILTKTDARKYIWDLVTLSYLFGDCTCRKDKALSVGATNNSGAQNTPQSSQRPRGVYAIAMTGAITGVTDNIADSGAYDNADDVADDNASDNASDNADDGAADDINANADIDAAI